MSYLPSDGNEHFRSRYEVWEGNERLRQTIFEGDWQTVTVQDLAADLKGLNLTIAEAHDGVAGIRRP